MYSSEYLTNEICIHPYYLLPKLQKRKLVTDLEFRLHSDENKMAEDKNKALLRTIQSGEKKLLIYLYRLWRQRNNTPGMSTDQSSKG